MAFCLIRYADKICRQDQPVFLEGMGALYNRLFTFGDGDLFGDIQPSGGQFGCFSIMIN